MSYVSEELTHFVGRSLPTDDDRLELLCSIIDSGTLLDPGHIGRHDRIFLSGLQNNETGEFVDAVEYFSTPNVRHDITSKLSNNQLVQFEIVCFCDIPLPDLGIHCRKYSRFGLAFPKPFLVRQGAAPVMYVPVTGAVRMKLTERHVKTNEVFYEEEKDGTRGPMFDELFERHNRLGLLRYRQLETELLESGEHEHIDRVVRDLRTMLFYQTAVEANFFGHLKFFDPALPEDDLDNYYMEREWRLNGQLKFTLGDLSRVLVPPEYVGVLCERYPELGSSITPLAAV